VWWRRYCDLTILGMVATCERRLELKGMIEEAMGDEYKED